MRRASKESASGFGKTSESKTIAASRAEMYNRAGEIWSITKGSAVPPLDIWLRQPDGRAHTWMMSPDFGTGLRELMKTQANNLMSEPPWPCCARHLERIATCILASLLLFQWRSLIKSLVAPV